MWLHYCFLVLQVRTLFESKMESTVGINWSKFLELLHYIKRWFVRLKRVETKNLPWKLSSTSDWSSSCSLNKVGRGLGEDKNYESVYDQGRIMNQYTCTCTYITCAIQVFARLDAYGSFHGVGSIQPFVCLE